MVRGIFIGRFQPLHNGHVSVIENAMFEVDELIIGIGSSQFGYTKTDPFTLDERIKMIEKSVKGNYKIVPIPDVVDYPAWVKHVEQRCPKFDVVYTGSPITRDLFRQAGYDVKEIEFSSNISGTEVRKLLSEKVRNKWQNAVPQGTLEVILECNGEDRLYYLHENYKYPKATLTVDGVIDYNGKIVLIKRGAPPFKGMFAIPGGHVDTGENVEKAVIREIKEETGLEFKIKGFLGVYSELGRDPRGYYATNVFYGDGSGELRAGDDAASVFVFGANELPEELAFDHKRILIDYLKTVGSDKQ